MLRTLIFDWDGTLHNTRALYGGAFRAAYSWLVEAGQAPARRYTDEELSVYLGINAREMWKNFMPGLSQELRDRGQRHRGERMVAGIKAGPRHTLSRRGGGAGRDKERWIQAGLSLQL